MRIYIPVLQILSKDLAGSVKINLKGFFPPFLPKQPRR